MVTETTQTRLVQATNFVLALVLAKVLVEPVLFVACYQVHRSFGFGEPATVRKTTTPAAVTSG